MSENSKQPPPARASLKDQKGRTWTIEGHEPFLGLLILLGVVIVILGRSPDAVTFELFVVAICMASAGIIGAALIYKGIVASLQKDIRLHRAENDRIAKEKSELQAPWLKDQQSSNEKNNA